METLKNNRFVTAAARCSQLLNDNAPADNNF